jgi:uncharacterized membrane protein YeaQ/YmgE (transglycosylase-associated protein family)
MGLIITLVLAGIIGWVASMIMKTDGQMGWVANIIAGIVGGFIGNLLLGWIAPASPTNNGLSIVGIAVGIVGACIAIWLWQAISKR